MHFYYRECICGKTAADFSQSIGEKQFQTLALIRSILERYRHKQIEMESNTEIRVQNVNKTHELRFFIAAFRVNIF